MQNTFHVLILGEGESGKSTLSDILTREAGLRGCASSLFMAPYVAAKLGYPNADAAYATRRSRRAEWKQAIVDYRKGDPARVVRELYSQYEIYEGLRDREEFECAKAEGLFDIIMFVDRGFWDGPGKWRRTTRQDESMDLTRADADLVIENSGSAVQFEAKCHRLARFILTLRQELTT